MGYSRREAFKNRYRPLFRRVHREYPGFWRELGDIWQEYLESRYTTRGAIVRDWPATAETGAQTDHPAEPSSRDVACQTNPMIQVGPALESWLAEVERWARSDQSHRPTNSGCWNCGSPRHRYSQCPQPRDQNFCYGCGRRGVTLRECGRCREEWRRERRE